VGLKYPVNVSGIEPATFRFVTVPQPTTLPCAPAVYSINTKKSMIDVLNAQLSSFLVLDAHTD
jgi:hypothetical protein